MQNRGTIFAELVSQLQSVLLSPTGPCMEVSANFRPITEESPATLPAVYLVALDEPVENSSDDPVVERIKCQLEVYMDKGNLIDKDSVPVITPVLNLIDMVLGQEGKNPVTGRDNNLGGLVRLCRRASPTKYILDSTGIAVGAIVPVEILVNQ